MIEDEKELLRICKYWANRLSTSNISVDELINEAYVAAKKLSDIRLAQKWVKWMVIRYIQRDMLSRAGISLSNADYPSIEDDIADESFSFQEFVEMEEELMAIMNKVCSEKEKDILRKKFWEGLSIREIGKHYKLSFQAIHLVLKKALKKLRKEYGKRTGIRLHSNSK